MSFDDIVSTFWDDDSSAVLGRSCSMNSSESEFSFLEFLKEASGGDVRGDDPMQQQCCEDRNGNAMPTAGGGFAPPLFASTEDLRAMNNVIDCGGEDDDLSVQFNPLFPSMPVDGEPKNFTSFAVAGDVGSTFERSLKLESMEIAAAAASLFRGNGDGGSMGFSVGSALPVPNFAIRSSAGISALPSAGHGASASAPRPPAWKPEADASGKPKLMTSGSEVSDDEGQLLLNLNLSGSELKRVKRMISNRESARKSRRRKLAQLGELEEQVSHLTDENSRLINRLQEVSHLHRESAIETRILKADVEALRAKVKMAAGMMAQQGQPGMAGFIPDSSCSFMTPYMSNDLESPFAGHSSMLRHDPPQGNMDPTALMQQAACLERLQQRIRNRSSCNAPAWGGWEADRPAMVQERGI